ncbi:MAG: hypothetical protein HC767_05305 [Akkermansiaceae bacterium]|nr:hypothetical protein [Akkermansiaceae bacterium]
MEDIYDRTKWPTPEANPLVQLLLRGDEWYTNREINAAFDPARAKKPNGAPMANLAQTMKIIGGGHTMLRMPYGRSIATNANAGTHGGTERLYSRERW